MKNVFESETGLFRAACDRHSHGPRYARLICVAGLQLVMCRVFAQTPHARLLWLTGGYGPSPPPLPASKSPTDISVKTGYETDIAMRCLARSDDLPPPPGKPPCRYRLAGTISSRLYSLRQELCPRNRAPSLEHASPDLTAILQSVTAIGRLDVFTVLSVHI